MTKLNQVVEAHQRMGENICQRLIDEALKTGFVLDELTSLPAFTEAQFSMLKDPFTTQENLVGVWLNQTKHQIGQIQFLSDGSFYAEYDVVKPHPTKSKWFVEAITAWGSADQMTAEPKLLPMAD